MCLPIVAPRFINVPQSVEALIGSAVNLSCSADGFPAPVITWTFQAMPFTNETVNSSNSTYTESTIVITNLLLSHGGSYSCQIDSDAAVMPISSEANVTVIGGKCMLVMDNRYKHTMFFNLCTYICTYVRTCTCGLF